MKTNFASVFDEPDYRYMGEETVEVRRINRCVWTWVAAGIIAAAAIACVSAWQVRGAARTDETDILLRGPRVGQLQPGAAVRFDGLNVGVVDSVVIEAGEAVARLRLTESTADKVPKKCRYVVQSLNSVAPGNVGVVISPPHTPSASQLGSNVKDAVVTPSLRVKKPGYLRAVVADGSFLPAVVPLGFYGTIAVAIIVGSVSLGVALKIVATPWLRWISLLGSVVAAALALRLYPEIVSLVERFTKLFALALAAALIGPTATFAADPMIFLVAVDVSGSMNSPLPAPVQARLSDSTKLEDVKRRLPVLADYIGVGTRVIVTKFDHQASRVCDITVNSPADREKLRKAFASMHSRQGSTHLWRTADGQLELAKQLVDANPELRVRVLLYTDGEDMEHAPGLDHKTLIQKYGNVLQTVVALDWITLGYDLQTPTKKALTEAGVRFTRVDNFESDIIPLRAGFTLSAELLSVNEEISLRDESLGVEINRRGVDWGDNSSVVYGDSPCHRYQNPGEYLVRYTVENARGARNEASTRVRVSLPAPPTAKIEVSQSSVRAGEPVDVVDASAGEVVKRSWQCSDGQTFSTQRISLTLKEPGDYTLELTVLDRFQQSVQAKATIHVDPPGAPCPAIKTSRDRVQVGEPIEISDSTPTPIKKRFWHLDNGRTSNEKVVTLSFADPGEHPIELSVEDAYGQIARTVARIVVDKPRPPHAAFRFSTTAPTIGDTVTLINESSETAIRFLWTLADGRQLDDKHPTLEISKVADVAVNLEAWDRFGQSSQASQTLSVSRPEKPTVDFDLPATIRPGVPLALVDRSTGLIDGNGEWYVDDNLLARSLDCHYTPAIPGSHWVRRVVSGPGGDGELARELTVLPFDPPKAGFTVGSDTPFVGDEIKITDTSSGEIEQVTYTFGGSKQPVKFDAQRRREQNWFVLSCDHIGDLQITQNVVGPGGKDQAVAQLTVATRAIQPRAAFNVDVIRGDGVLTATFANRSTGTAVKAVFDPGDGSKVQTAHGAADFHHTYSPGQWRPKVTLFGPDDLAPSAWNGDVIEVAAPLPLWIWRLWWQIPIGFCTASAVVVGVRKRAITRSMTRRALLNGQLVVRLADKPRHVQYFDFNGGSAEEVVDIDVNLQIKITSHVDSNSQIVRYGVQFLSSGAPAGSVMIDADGEARFEQYIVTYTA